MSFRGKRVMITGAGRGLGAAFAAVLAGEGAHVIMAARNPENLNATAESIRLRTGVRPETLVLDLADVSQVTLTAKKMRDEGTPLDILINNGAQWLSGGLNDNDALAIASTITSGVTGTLLFTRGLLPLLEKSGAGDILNIVSITGLPNARLGNAAIAFSAAKHAQAGITDGLRQELRGNPVRVIGVYPPWLDDVSPFDDVAWHAGRDQGSRTTSRDVVEASLFALSRPRHVTLASIVMDSDQGGIFAD
ncbi:SDR family oxidoreductase [Aestuariivirga sp.]|uniref:SDR family oxidoreductase n=1 Tax=Aestuariivirga sp. TaxID=2650926 RepID=UPI0039E2A55B